MILGPFTHRLTQMYSSIKSEFSLPFLDNVPPKYVPSTLASFRALRRILKFSAIILIFCLFNNALEILHQIEFFCCVGSPGVFITPGTYHVLARFLNKY